MRDQYHIHITDMFSNKRLNEFLTLAYANHDSAHNLGHIFRVYDTALTIVDREHIVMTQKEAEEFPYVMSCHDVRDHKLAQKDLCLSQEQVYKFYEEQLGTESANKIVHIHDNCSWSKRARSIPLESGDWMRRVLQDADWIDAMGRVGLTRCIEYSKFIINNSHANSSTNSGANDNTEVDTMIKYMVCQHIRDKLLLIPDNLYYDSSKELVRDRSLISPLLRYLAKNEE
jgi:uncharacterized protein